MKRAISHHSQHAQNTSTILKEFQGFTVQHPRFRRAISIIMESIVSTTELNEPSSAILLGSPGTGKSKVCRRLENLIGYPYATETPAGHLKIIPCFYCEVPEDVTIKKLAQDMLHKLGCPSSSRETDSLHHRIVTWLKLCQTKLVILDEFQHLARKGAIKTRESVCDWIKALLNESGIPFLLVGTPDLEPIVDDNEQLSQRYPYRISLRNLEYRRSQSDSESEWDLVLGKFTAEMVRLGKLKEYIFLSDHIFSTAAFISCAGNMRGLRRLLHAAFKKCLIRGDQKLLREDFAAALSEIIIKTRIKPDINPFVVPYAKLAKILNHTS